MEKHKRPVDAVFEGGGVRGIGLVGALSVVERQHRFVNVAGTSAGAIVASLVASGYTAAEIEKILMELDFTRLTDLPGVGALPVIGGVAGPVYSLVRHYGIYEGDYFLQFMRDLLAARGVVTFAQLVQPEYARDPKYRYRLRVVASDVTRGRMLVLPQDARYYGRDPDTLDVALAVRMSMSIPYFFDPVQLTRPGGETSYVVDGGLLSNFPVHLFDSPGVEWPTFGFRLVASKGKRPAENEVHGVLSMAEALFKTMMCAHDSYYIETHDFVRSILIDTLGISPVNFRLSLAQKRRLFRSGVTAAEEFLARWDFDEYVRTYRSGAPAPHRRQLTDEQMHGTGASRSPARPVRAPARATSRARVPGRVAR